MTEIILASSSPRRRELLSKYNINIKIFPSNIKEKISGKEEPACLAMALSYEKALDVSKRVKCQSVIIGADTIVYKDKILGKPKSEEDAFKMLKFLSGKKHEVITGISLVKSGTNMKFVDYEKTIVKFRDITEDEIREYIKTGEPMDKAGSYGIQGYGEIFVEYIIGSYSNVVGLPMSKLDCMLEKYFDICLL